MFWTWSVRFGGSWRNLVEVRVLNEVAFPKGAEAHLVSSAIPGKPRVLPEASPRSLSEARLGTDFVLDPLCHLLLLRTGLPAGHLLCYVCCHFRLKTAASQNRRTLASGPLPPKCPAEDTIDVLGGTPEPHVLCGACHAGAGG